ncbi:MAG: hypothetical protein JWL85_772 [Candidatus Saccharibacteria bacterium]|nr:hypothetical protein [Candidatus Saccharibacteria bacterium]
MRVPDISEYQDIPRTAIVLGRKWDADTPPDVWLPPIEARMRVTALGVLATEGLVDTAAFSGGHTRPHSISEARSMRMYLDEEFPDLQIDKLLEEKSLDTAANARLTGELFQDIARGGPFTLISSGASLWRQTRIFEEEGFDIHPVAAEPLVALRSLEHAAMVRKYLRSPRHQKTQLLELGMRGLLTVDRKGILTKRISSSERTRFDEGLRVEPRSDAE